MNRLIGFLTILMLICFSNFASAKSTMPVADATITTTNYDTEEDAVRSILPLLMELKDKSHQCYEFGGAIVKGENGYGVTDPVTERSSNHVNFTIHRYRDQKIVAIYHTNPSCGWTENEEKLGFSPTDIKFSKMTGYHSYIGQVALQKMRVFVPEKDHATHGYVANGHVFQPIAPISKPVAPDNAKVYPILTLADETVSSVTDL